MAHDIETQIPLERSNMKIDNEKIELIIQNLIEEMTLPIECQSLFVIFEKEDEEKSYFKLTLVKLFGSDFNIEIPIIYRKIYNQYPNEYIGEFNIKYKNKSFPLSEKYIGKMIAYKMVTIINERSKNAR